MASWNDVTTTAPDLATAVEGRFAATGLGFLATVRADGAPRICGIEPLFAHGELWLGMMDGSRKLADLRRDPRLALHSASIDKNVADGDAKLSGRAVAVEDEERFEQFRAAFIEESGAAPEGPFPLFTVDITEVSFLRPAGDHLDIDIWREGAEVRRVKRF